MNEGVVTPDFNPNDIAIQNNQGNVRVGDPNSFGPWNQGGDQQILTGGGSRGTGVNPNLASLADKANTQPQGLGSWMPNPSAPGGKSWVGVDYSSQGGGPQATPMAQGSQPLGLNSLSTKAKKMPTRTLAQTYR